MDATLPGFSQQVSGRARTEASPDPELGIWAESYCPNLLGGSQMLVVDGAQSLPEVTCVFIESPVVATYLGQLPVGFSF